MKVQTPPEAERRSRVVAVGGAKGSPGCTFVAVGLARCFAEHGLETLLVDADAEDGGVGTALGLPGRQPAAFGRAAALGLEADVLRDASIDAGPRLRVLEVAAAEFGESAADGRELVAAARRDHPAVVVDLGHTWTRLQRQLASGADWLLWVAVPDRQGLERADRALARMLHGGGRGLIVNRSGRWSVRGADRALVERHSIPLVARLPEHRRAARRVSERGVAAHRLRQFRSAFQRLARTVHPDLDGGGRWP